MNRITFGFGHTRLTAKEGEMCWECPRCPRPDVNLPPGWQTDPEKSAIILVWMDIRTNEVAIRYRYAPTIMIDGNMTADHQRPKWAAEDVCLSDGTGYFVTREPFTEHCETAANIKTVNADKYQYYCL